MSSLETTDSGERLGTAAARSGKLSGQLSVAEIVFTVLAYNAPLTVIIAIVPLLLGIGNGLGAPLTFIASGALMLLFAVGFTTMSSHVPNAGAYYAYITLGLGRNVGLGSASIAVLAYAFLLTGGYLYAGTILKSLLTNVFGGSGPFAWWQLSLLVAAAVSALGYFKISLSAKVLTIALACEVLIVLAWEGSITYSLGTSALTANWLTPEAASSGSLGIAILLGVTCFAGFEATAVFRGEASNPAKTIPRATYIAIIVMALLFASATYFFIIGFTPSEAVSVATTDPLGSSLKSIEIFLGATGLKILEVLMVTSIFACLLAMHNILSRYVYFLSSDRILPVSWSHVHKRHGSPHRASLVVTVIVFVVDGMLIQSGLDAYETYAALVGMAGYALLLLQILTSLAVIIFFARKSFGASRIKTFVAPALSLVGLTSTAWFATEHLELLTGNESAAKALLGLIYGLFIAACLYARILKTARPDVYKTIGGQDV